MDAVSFDDTLGEVERVVASGLHENEVIPVNSVDMYIIIEDLRQLIEEERTVKIQMNYKTVDKKVKLVATPLCDDRWEQIKGVVVDRSLGDPQGIGYRFIDET